jgi:RHS repeat-associated protein
MLTLFLLGISLTREAQAFYNPSTGRWLSRDPIGELGSLLMSDEAIDNDDDLENDGNLYQVVNNNPIIEIDSLGLWPSSSPFLGILLKGRSIPSRTKMPIGRNCRSVDRNYRSWITRPHTLTLFKARKTHICML